MQKTLLESLKTAAEFVLATCFLGIGIIIPYGISWLVEEYAYNLVIVFFVCYFIIVYAACVSWEICKNKFNIEELESKSNELKTKEIILNNKYQNQPYLSELIADFHDKIDKSVEDHLRYKSRPATKSADAVKAIRQEKKQLAKEKQMLEYQLKFYEDMFPWLEDFKEVSIQDAMEYAKDYSIDTDPISRYLSPEEYSKLTVTEKNQRALDRYVNRKKTNWEAGIEYERYIGYRYEQKGYQIEYCGATQGLEDMGRDLIARKDKNILVIQCKRWATEKTIHEKHIFQLFGTTTLMCINNPKANIKGIFITTTKVSDIARKCANYLGIELVENLPFVEYPRIKCNISRKDGTKIYHLPFDQQYDKVIIEPHLGEMYCSTVEEAEKNGFRRAYKYNPNKY